MTVVYTVKMAYEHTTYRDLFATTKLRIIETFAALLYKAT